jgi:hypothetical protein
MTSLTQPPPEMRCKMCGELDAPSLMKLGDSHKKFIPEIVKAASPQKLMQLWFLSATYSGCKWLWLHYMIKSGFPVDTLEVVRILIAAGTNLDVKDNEGFTALYLGCAL